MASFRLALSRVILLYILNLNFLTLVAKEKEKQYFRLGHPDVIWLQWIYLQENVMIVLTSKLIWRWYASSRNNHRRILKYVSNHKKWLILIIIIWSADFHRKHSWQLVGYGQTPVLVKALKTSVDFTLILVLARKGGSLYLSKPKQTHITIGRSTKMIIIIKRT